MLSIELYVLLKLPNTPMRRYYYYPHLIAEDIEAQVMQLARVAQQAARTRFLTSSWLGVSQRIRRGLNPFQPHA